MNEKISNTIAAKQQNINEIIKLKDKIRHSIGKDVRFRIETKHWYGYAEDFHFGKERDILDIPSETMIIILDGVIEKEKERINKLIDMEIENKNKKEGRHERKKRRKKQKARK